MLCYTREKDLCGLLSQPNGGISNMDLNSVSSTTHIFGNDLLFRKIAGYLGIPDLKILRQTSKSMLDKVNNIPGFIKNLEITICLECVREGVIAQTTLPFRKANLAVEDYDSPNLEEIKKCLREVQDLEIRVQTSPHLEHVHQICDFILQLEDLKSLSVPGEFLTWENVIRKIGRKLSTLEGLRLYRKSMECGDYYRSLSKIKTNQNWAPELGSLDWKLKSFHAEKAYLPTSNLTGILESSASTMETIELISSYRDIPIPVNSFGDLIFPHLKSIKFSINSLADEEEFGAFLRNQPSLECIQVGASPRSVRYVPRQYISHQIMDAIREKSSQLKALDFYGDNAKWRQSFCLSWDWEFLQLCGKLKEFRLSLGHLGPYLPHLPSNVESLDLFDLRADGVHPVALVEGFPHLTQLKFASPTALTDDILQAICRNNTALRVFHFWIGPLGYANADVTHVTDFGLTGERGVGHEDSGISLRNLKGLRELVMFGRGPVTMEGLVKAIQFQELRILELTTAHNSHNLVPEGSVLEIAKNNPSLEYLNCYIGLMSEDSVVPLFRKIRAVNQRMTKFGIQIYDSIRKSTCKPSYGISSMALGSEFRVAKNGRGELVFTIFGSTEKETAPSVYAKSVKLPGIEDGFPPTHSPTCN